MDNLVYNDGKEIFMKLDGKYHKRVIGTGWLPIDESALPADIPWSPMPEIQRLVYAAQLPGRE